MTWVNSKFKKKIEVKSGYTWSGDQELYENREGSTAVLRVSNIQETLELDDILYLINVSEQHKIDKKISKNWTIAVNSNGNRNRVGKGIFIEEDMEFLFASFLVAFKPFDENEIDPRYFYYWYSSETVQKRISAIAEGTTGLSNLELRYLKSQDIYHPASIVEQRYIANTINAVDKTIQATKNSIAKLEKLKTSLMQNLLTGKMKPDGSWRTEDDFWVDDKFGKVPNGWVVMKLKNVFKLSNGKANPKSNLLVKPNSEYNIPVYGGNGITGFFNEHLINQQTLIIGRVGEYCGAVYKINEPCWITDNALWISEILVDNFDFDFWYYFLIYKKLNQYGDATGQPKVTQSRIGSLSMIYPSSEIEQNQIAKAISTVSKNIETKVGKIERLSNLKKSLMQNLLTGKVRIPQQALKK